MWTLHSVKFTMFGGFKTLNEHQENALKYVVEMKKYVLLI